MMISRLDLDGAGSPVAIADRIHELQPDLPRIVPLEGLCQQLDITSVSEIETQSFEAALIMDELKASGTILLAAGRRAERSRFSLAHELGHFLIPSHRPTKAHPFECSLDHLLMLDVKNRDKRRRIEAEANRFAAHLLMPPRRVRTAIAGSAGDLQSIIAMSSEFGVSKEAMARAWVDANHHPVAIVIAHRGRVARQYRNDDFPWLITAKGHSLPGTAAAALASLTPGSYSQTEEVDPEEWISERDAKRVLELSEQVLAQSGGYAMVLLRAELDDE